MRLLTTALAIAVMVALASCGGEASRQRTTFPTDHAAAHGQEARSQPIVASKWSSKFHKPKCKWARRIKPGNLVGYDVDMAHRLASDLGVELELVPFVQREQLARHLAEDHFDIAMSGLAGVLSLAEMVRITDPYLEVHLALLVPDHKRDDLGTREALMAQEHVRIGTPGEDPFVRRIALVYPNLELVPVDSVEDFAEGRVKVDAMLVSAEAGSSWTLRYPRFCVVTPGRKPIGLPLVYAIPEKANAFAQYVNRWLDLKRRDATLDMLYDHWILGLTAMPKEPRWSVIRNVLHWVD